MSRLCIHLGLLCTIAFAAPLQAGPALVLQMPKAESAPVIDADLDDWAAADWRLFAPEAPHCLDLMEDDGTEPPGTARTAADLSGHFALAWDDGWIYLAARVTDNVHDVGDNEPGFWWRNDSISLFLDVPLDRDGMPFRLGDHVFSFVADPTIPEYGKWWRHGSSEGLQEVPAPPETQLAVRLTATGYVLEAAIPLDSLVVITPEFSPPFAGRSVGFMFLATDADNNLAQISQINYGGDDNSDAKWSRLYFAPPLKTTTDPVLLSGVATYQHDGSPWIGSVRIEQAGGALQTRTDGAGRYRVEVPPGAYHISAGLQSIEVIVVKDTPVRDADLVVPPTMARLHFNTPPGSIGGFAAGFAEKIAPLLQKHGLQSADHSQWGRVDSVHSRLFALASPEALFDKQAALEADPAWRQAVREFATGLGVVAADSIAPVEFRLFAAPAGEGLTLPTGSGQTKRGGLPVQAGTGHRQGAWLNLGIFDGLYSPVISHIVQDDKGYLWFGTNSGLARYDGGQFTHFHSSNVLPHSRIQSLFEDRQGNIWVGAGDGLRRGGAFGTGGITRFDGESWTTFTTEDGLGQTLVTAIAQDPQGLMWFGTAGGVSRFDGKQWTLFTPADGLAHSMVHAIFADREGQLWFGTAGGVSRYDGRMWTTYTAADGLADNAILAIAEDQRGHMWFGTAAGVSRFDGQRFVAVGQGVGVGLARADTVRAIVEDREGNMWFATHRGVGRFDGRTYKTLTTADGLAHDNVLSLLEDREGNMWFGSDGGISQYSGDRVIAYTTADGLSSDRVLTAMEDSRGQLWFGTSQGLDRHNGAESGDAASQITTVTAETDSTPVVVWSIAEDRQGQLWVSSANVYMYAGSWLFNVPRGGGLRRYDGESWSSLPIEEFGNFGDSALDILEARDGTMWFGTVAGLHRYDGEALEFFDDDNKDGDTLLEDRNGHIWSGSYFTGVSRYDGREVFTIDAADSLGSNWIEDMLEDRQGRLWFATRAGLSRMEGDDLRTNPADSASVEFTHFTTEDGLANPWTTSLLEDGAGLLWIGTYGGGISIFDGFAFQNITVQDGLPGNVIRDLAWTRNGDMLVATESGAARLQIDHTPPPINITDVVADRDYGPVAAIRLPSSQGILIFEFQGISFKAHADRMLYKYRLQGLDEEWRLGREKRVQYTNLSSGEYVFEVYAIDRNLNYSAAPAQVRVEIHPPYAQIALQSGLGLALTGLFVFMGVSLRQRAKREQAQQALVDEQQERLSEQQRLMRQLEEANAQIQEANRLKSEFLANMSHELRTPLNSVIGMSDILLEKYLGDLNEQQDVYVNDIRESGQHLLSLINDILDLSKVEAGHSPLELAEVDLKPLLEHSLTVVRERALRHNIELSCTAPEDLPLITADERKVRQVVFNLLSNAVKFTPDGGKIGVEALRENGEITVCVWDTGVGIAPEDHDKIFRMFEQADGSLAKKYEGSGLGLTLVRRFVEQHRGHVWLESEKDRGSRFYFTLPLES